MSHYYIEKTFNQVDWRDVEKNWSDHYLHFFHRLKSKKIVKLFSKCNMYDRLYDVVFVIDSSNITCNIFLPLEFSELFFKIFWQLISRWTAQSCSCSLNTSCDLCICDSSIVIEKCNNKQTKIFGLVILPSCRASQNVIRTQKCEFIWYICVWVSETDIIEIWSIIMWFELFYLLAIAF